MSKGGERPNPVADDFSDGQHWHGEDRSGSTPHPEPEDERDDDENGIEGEPLGEKHRSYRLAFDQMNSEVQPGRQERLPKRVIGQQASEEKDHHPENRTKDRHEVKQKSDCPPENRVADPREPHNHSRGNADCGVHERNRNQIGRDIAFDLLRDVDRLALIAEAWQYLDEAAQECVTRHEQEKEKQYCRKESAGKIPGAGESFVISVEPPAEKTAAGAAAGRP